MSANLENIRVKNLTCLENLHVPKWAQNTYFQQSSLIEHLLNLYFVTSTFKSGTIFDIINLKQITFNKLSENIYNTIINVNNISLNERLPLDANELQNGDTILSTDFANNEVEFLVNGNFTITWQTSNKQSGDNELVTMSLMKNGIIMQSTMYQVFARIIQTSMTYSGVFVIGDLLHVEITDVSIVGSDIRNRGYNIIIAEN